MIDANNLFVPIPILIIHFMIKRNNTNSYTWIINVLYSKKEIESTGMIEEVLTLKY